MSGMRKWLCLFLGVAFAAFALPAAAQKVYTLNMNAPSGLFPGGAGQTVTASFNNISSDTGNSSVKSIKLFAPSGITITNATLSGSGYTATIQNNGTSVFLSSIQLPLKPFGPTLTLTMTVSVTCTATGTGWTTKLNGVDQVWNGAGFTGQTFAFVNTAANPSVVDTPVSGVCGTISFVNQPATTFVSTPPNSIYPITTTPYNNPTGQSVTVNLTINQLPAPDGTPVNLSVSAGTCSIANGSANTVGGVATFSGLIGTATGTACKLTASGGGVHPNAVSAPFDIVVVQGVLSCSDPNQIWGGLDISTTPPTTSGNGDTDWALFRGQNRTIPPSCGPDTPFTFTLDSANHSAIFTEDSLGQPTSVEYVILWTPVPIDTDGWAGKQPCVSWGKAPPLNWIADPVYGCAKASDYVPGLICLLNDVNGGDAVMPTIPDVEPYHNNPNPQYRPFLSDGITPQKAKVCVVQNGSTSDNGLVQYWTKIIDQSDAGIRLP